VGVDSRDTSANHEIGDEHNEPSTVAAILSLAATNAALQPFVNRAGLELASIRQDHPLLDPIAAEDPRQVPALGGIPPDRRIEPGAPGHPRSASAVDANPSGLDTPILERFVANIPDALPGRGLEKGFGPLFGGGPLSGAVVLGSPAASIGPESGFAADLGNPDRTMVNEMLARLPFERSSLTDPTALFSWASDSTSGAFLPADSAGGIIGDLPFGPGNGHDRGWLAGPAPAETWGMTGPIDAASVPAVGQPLPVQAGPDNLGSESIAELTSRLLQAAERLEQAADRLAPQAPYPPGSAPRPFRGRVDA